MNRIQTSFIVAGFAVMSLFSGNTAGAQTNLPDGATPMIVAPHQLPVGYMERTICYDITANIPYEVSSDQAWATVRKGTDGTIYVHLTQNYNSSDRTAVISLTNSEMGVTQTINIVQQRDNSATTIPTAPHITPQSATANTENSTAEGIAKTIDGNTSTFWHSKWSGTKFEVSENNPAVITYKFRVAAADSIDYINYIPRQDSQNGAFGKVEMYMRLIGETDTKLYGTYDWGQTQTAKTITFEKSVKPAEITFKIYSGYGGWACCAEMEFVQKTPVHSDFGIFEDELYTKLKDGVTLGDIESMTNPFAKSLAMNIFNGQYDMNYRVAKFPCKLSVQTLAARWKTPGKYYDQTEGVTGISFGPGTHAVIVKGLPEGKNATLKLVSWYNGIVGGNFDGGNPQEKSYPLSNGMNIIKFDPEKDFTYLNKGNGGKYLRDYDALGYISYEDSENPAAYNDIEIHFVNGEVNGYLSLDKTNDEMHEITANAKNYCMDVFGRKAHQVWTSQGLHDYCRAIDGSIGYRQYMNIIDSLVQWEHDLLGFTKYNMQPDNRTFAYVNFTYYMFQGGRGVSFHQDQESRVLNCEKMANRDDDAIWGLSHEWGHQHQMHPYFCWKGMAEVTNNMNAYYNIMRMGYRTSDKINQWVPARKHFIQDNLSGVDLTSNQRRAAWLRRSNMSWNTDYNALLAEMEDSIITTQADNVLRGVGITEVGVGETLCPYIMLYVYFTRDKGMTDFGPDMYEALRRTEKEGGSDLEKQSGIDKYELVAMAQNNNTNNAIDQLNEKFAASVWTKYITKEHCGTWDNNMPYILNYIRKVSRLTGYNLFPYFEKWGFLRNTALYIGDYGDGWQIFTKAAYDEFKADMDALVTSGELKEMPEGMVEEISNAANYFQAKPSFPN